VRAGRIGALLRSPAGRRSSLALVDQALSSITNFVLSVVIARALPAAEFGAFGIAFAVYMLARGLSNAMWSAPVIIRHAGTEPELRLDQVAISAGTALVTGVISGVAVAVAGLLLGGSVGGALLALSICLPGLLLQDAWRQGFITHAQPGKAAVNDGIWAVLQLVAVIVIIRSVDEPSVAALTLGWGLAGTVAALLASWQARRGPAVRGGWQMVRDHRHLGPQFAAEFALTNGQAQVTLVALAALSGTTATAGFRGAQVLFGPQRVLSNGLLLSVLPEGVRIRSSMHRLRWLVRALSVVNTGLVLAVGVVLLALPDSVGEALLGDSWGPTQPVILPMIAFGITGTVVSGPSMGLRVIEKAGACLRNQMIVSPVTVLATIVGMVLGGAEGAAWGMAAGGLLNVAIWVRSWVVESARVDRASAGASAGAGAAEDRPELALDGDVQ
jgi:O-antigen/teichoic acid export membrane protein